MAAVLACAAFGTVCGSSVATAATVTQVALPEMRRHRYSGRLATATLAAGGTLGILIPPSVVLVVYAILTEQNIAKLFAAAVIPGVLAATGYVVAIAVYVRLVPGHAPEAPRAGPGERRAAAREVWPIGVIFLLVFGGIYGGVFTPTEGAGIGAAGMFVIAVAKRELGLQALKRAFLGTAETTGMVFLIFLGADMLNSALALSQMPAQLAQTVATLSLPPVAIVAGILILVAPRLLNYVVAIYLIAIGVVGLFGLGLVELEVQALEADRLADPQAGGGQQLEERRVALGRDRQEGGELLAAEDLDLLLGQLLAVGHGKALGGVVADQALALGARQGGAQRDHGVGDRAVAEALALLLLGGEPVHVAGQGVGAHVDQLQLAREVAVGVGADQATVFLAGALAEAAPALAAVALDPFIEVAQEADRRALLKLAAVAVGLALALEPLRLLEGAGVALSLPPGAAEDGDVADRPALAINALEDAGRLGLAEPPLVAAAGIGRVGRRILGNAHEHHLVSRGRAVLAAPPHLRYRTKR